jgi:methionyl-tRNA formyltransferase
MRTFLICHEDEPLNRIVLPRWLASFSTLAGMIVLRETREQKQRRIKREMKRVGFLRFLDVLAFRLYYAAFLADTDRQWEQKKLTELSRRYPDIPDNTPLLVSTSPNTTEAREFLRSATPDLMLARCKFMLKEEIFTIPPSGTFVMHPGICPEYRNAHGCFWALANDDLERVGMTLLRIDRGVDTGPVFGHYRCRYDERSESHIVIQHRTVFDNLDALQKQLMNIHQGNAVSVDVTGRQSAAWGQPWLTKYFHWKQAAKKR